MNTDVTAWLWSAERATAQPALAEVERAFQAAHARFTRFDPDSELSALNWFSGQPPERTSSGGQPFVASPDLFEVVELALHYCALTGGVFNPAILGALEAAGYDRTFDAVARQADDRRLPDAAPVACPAVELIAEYRIITLPAGVRLDLGGIVKGWTVQRTAQRLARFGPCLVDAGGDMLAMGAPPELASGWQVGVADPFDARRDLAQLRLRDRAVATSGIDRRRWTRNGVMQHHLIDPRTGRPSDGDLMSVTLIAPTAIEAEVYAKTVFLLGARAGLKFVDDRPALAALLVTRAGDVLSSARLENVLDVHFVYDTADFVAA